MGLITRVVKSVIVGVYIYIQWICVYSSHSSRILSFLGNKDLLLFRKWREGLAVPSCSVLFCLFVVSPTSHSRGNNKSTSDNGAPKQRCWNAVTPGRPPDDPWTTPALCRHSHQCDCRNTAQGFYPAVCTGLCSLFTLASGHRIHVLFRYHLILSSNRVVQKWVRVFG